MAPDRALLFKDHLVILNKGMLRDKLLYAYYDNLRAGHIGSNQTAELIRCKFH